MGSHKPLLIKHVDIYIDNERWQYGSLLINGNKIEAISEETDGASTLPESCVVIDGNGLKAIPGFIDGHIHGAAGADVMDATEQALDTIAQALPAEGTTSFLATTITQAPENIERALENVAHYDNKPGQAEVIGVHLEGPFIEKSKKGAQPEQYITKPNIEQFDRWHHLSGHQIKTITMAPEHDEDGSFIRHLASMGINVSAGHTSTDFAGMKQAVAHGVRQVTHICNAMTAIHHREVGVVGAAFLLEELRAELIADEVHVVPDMMQLIYNNIGSERLLLITDAMRAKCLEAGRYELGGQPVVVSSDRAMLDSGSLAGSILKLKDGAKNMLKLSGVELEQIVEMASANPAKQIHMYDKKGRIDIGTDADILLVDDHLNIHYTICGGVIAYKED
ncbi:N-acetylglucosamine-6-phosphate deacetylase [Lentibacillus saliphilus]|uniref:N-acetylglucosamine-6-phosphate deacetylase n=1 Tax=Lentibacillus saliphilus TaxID=2737028 RepID=UPI001C2F2898|nr:N-acetylglucosamine-6-phosphate deacetylase [Lentibacillus saliphilus]